MDALAAVLTCSRHRDEPLAGSLQGRGIPRG
jgi:hypothetical protein